MFEKLCQPLQLGEMTLKNRMVMPPMVVRYGTDDGYATERTRDYYEARARGGVGLVILEASYVHPEGQIILNELGISDDKFIPRLSEVAAAIHRHGAKAAIQLVHGGRASISTHTGKQPLAPSAIAAPNCPLPRALTAEEISRIIECFARAALRAKRAGFDGVEFHAAHGYLIDQFISRASNQRNDDYGGSLPKRTRLLTDVIRAAKEVTGGGITMWCRIDGAEYGIENGITLEEAREVARLAEEAGAAAIHVSASGALSPVNTTAPAFVPAVIAELATGVKSAVSVPVIAVGKMTPEAGEEIIASGKADLIAFARAIFADPELANKVSSNNSSAIRPCIQCLRCRDDLRFNPVVGVRCSVNAAIGNEGKYRITQAFHPKKVLVVGGGPAGLEAARVAALRGHRVSLWERETSLGGQLPAASATPYKDRIGTLPEYFTGQLADLGVEVELGREATVSMITDFGPEALVLATGARPITPEIPGLDKAKTAEATAVLTGEAPVGERVLVIGAELVACEVAEYLAQQGKRITIMRRGPEVATKVGPSIRAPLLKRLKEKDVAMLTGVRYQRVTGEGLEITTGEGETRTLPADTIVLAAGSTPEQRLYQEIKDRVASVYLVGDAVSPRTIGDAISEAYLAARAI